MDVGFKRSCDSCGLYRTECKPANIAFRDSKCHFDFHTHFRSSVCNLGSSSVTKMLIFVAFLWLTLTGATEDRTEAMEGRRVRSVVLPGWNTAPCQLAKHCDNFCHSMTTPFFPSPFILKFRTRCGTDQ